MSWGDVSQEEKGHVMYPSIEQAGDDFCENLKPCHMLLNSVGLPSSDMWLLDSGYHTKPKDHVLPTSYLYVSY